VPISRLTNKAGKMAEGDFDTVIEVKSDDEIGTLTNTFNTMASRLKSTLYDISSERDKISVILKNLADGVMAFDADKEALHINPTAEKMLGIDARKKHTFDSIFEKYSIPVIMLTAKNSETDTVSALDYGADDYIKKPFGTKELIARVNAVLRRCTNSSSENNELTYKNIVLNVKKHTVYVDNQLILLSIKEFCLLKILMENIGSVVKKTDIMKSVWNYDDDIESRTVDVHLKNLRKKLNDDGNIIETVRGVGFSIGRKQI
jgi:two-component system alkaline phosphatase synthesis response regulator PhoP